MVAERGEGTAAAGRHDLDVGSARPMTLTAISARDAMKTTARPSFERARARALIGEPSFWLCP